LILECEESSGFLVSSAYFLRASSHPAIQPLAVKNTIGSEIAVGVRLAGPSLPEILLVSLLNLLPPWCFPDDSSVDFMNPSSHVPRGLKIMDTPKKKFALRISTVNCLGKKKLVMPVYL